MKALRRLFALVLMVLVPAQMSGAAAQALHGHFDGETPAVYHHHDASSAAAPDLDQEHHHDADGHHDGHCHPVFSVLMTAPGAPGLPPPHPPRLAARPAAYTSHIPPPDIRPPLALTPLDFFG